MKLGDATKRVLGWKGVLAEGNAIPRRMVAGVLVFLCVIPIFTQWGYVGILLPGGNIVHLMFMLVPVALAAMLLGTLSGTVAGLLAGTVLYAHSSLYPLDYYELVCVTPVTSVVMTTAFGFVLGILLSYALRGKRNGLRRMLFVALACLIASCIFSVGCAQALGWQAGQLSITVGPVAFQAVADGLILIFVCEGGLVLSERWIRKIGSAGLRDVFYAWLFALVLVAFLVVEVVSYGAITNSRFVEATKTSNSQVGAVLSRVIRLAEIERDLAESGGRAGNDLLSSLFEGYSEESDGLMVTLHNGIITGADGDSVLSGLTLADSLGDEVASAADRSVKEGTLERVVYPGLTAANDFVNLTVPGAEEELEALFSLQVGYLMAMESGEYSVVMIRPASMVFNARDDVVRWVFISSLVLFACMLALAQRLLGRLVAQRIDETNGALARITAGDLEVRVQPCETREFQELSAGINTTVDALRGWIAEAESRMDSELAAAKAIQESALPSVFPPFPDIHRFGIYACMDAAREVGGDFYDFFLIGDDCGPDSGKLAFVMADVSGKGVPAALFMMRVKTQIHDYLASGMKLGEAMQNANIMLCEGNDEGMFATVWVGVLDYATGHIDFANAGHNPPLLWHRGSWRWLREIPSTPLGLFDDETYPTYSLDCEAGDKILLYTDGVSEAFSVDMEQYGEDRLLRQVQECSALHPRELVNRVRASVEAYAAGAEQSDDITILALEIVSV